MPRGMCHDCLSDIELGAHASVGRMMRGSQLPASNGAVGSVSCSSVGPVSPSPMRGRGNSVMSVAAAAPGVSGPRGKLSSCSASSAADGVPPTGCRPKPPPMTGPPAQRRCHTSYTGQSEHALTRHNACSRTHRKQGSADKVAQQGGAPGGVGGPAVREAPAARSPQEGPGATSPGRGCPVPVLLSKSAYNDKHHTVDQSGHID